MVERVPARWLLRQKAVSTGPKRLTRYGNRPEWVESLEWRRCSH